MRSTPEFESFYKAHGAFENSDGERCQGNAHAARKKGVVKELNGS